MVAAGLYEDPDDFLPDKVGSEFSFDTYNNKAERYYLRIADYALNLVQRVKQVNERHGTHYEVRIGIHIGPIVAGVIGKRKFAYDVWGGMYLREFALALTTLLDTVNVSSRMESTGKNGCVQVSDRAYQLMKDHYQFEDRGLTYVKGKGDMKTYLLQGRRSIMDVQVASRRRSMDMGMKRSNSKMMNKMPENE